MHGRATGEKLPEVEEEVDVSDVAEGENDATLVDAFNDHLSSTMDPSKQKNLPESDLNTSKGSQIMQRKESSACLLPNQNFHYAVNQLPFNSAYARGDYVSSGFNTSSKLYTLPKLPYKPLSSLRLQGYHIQTPDYNLFDEDEEENGEFADYD